ncbi:MAG: tetratricopeptide repeat protein [Chthoniobacteraceae bacterium]
MNSQDQFVSPGLGRMDASISPGSSRGGFQKDWLWGLALVFMVVLAYLPAMRAGFIWDDDQHLTENPCIVGPLGFKGIWTTSEATYYPLTLTSFWVQHQLWGLNPWPYHLVNILVHAACTLLLWRVLRHLQIVGAWLGAALWAIHPVQVESVAWITELKNTQSCLFYLLAMLFFFHWRQREPAARRVNGSYLWALLWAALAILSKSSTVMLPVMLGLGWWWQDRRWSWRNVGWLVPFVFISLSASGWTIWEQKFHSGALGPEWSQSGLDRIVIAGRAFWFYLGKLVWPHPLIFIYPRWELDAGNPLEYLPALAAIWAVIALWSRRDGKLRPLFFAAACYTVSLFPVLGFFTIYFFRYSFVGDHFQYLASMAPLALVAAGIVQTREWTKGSWPITPMLAGAALIMGLGVLTWRQGAMYFNAETLWRTTIAREPSCWLAYADLGVIQQDKGDWDGAMPLYKKALQLNPNFQEALNDVGLNLAHAGHLAEAIEHFQQALQIDPLFLQPRFNIANLLLQQGQTDAAIEQFQKILEIKPEVAEAHGEFGLALQTEGRFDEAISQLQQAIALKPDYTEAHVNLGMTLQQKGQVDEAVVQYREALQINPNHPGANNDLGLALQQQGHLDEAIAFLEKALHLKPDYAEAENNLGNALAQKKDLATAVAHYRKALQINPNLVEACNNLAHILATAQDAQLRNGSDAVELASRANQLTSEANPIVMATLAAAYAEQGRFPEAVELVKKAIRLANTQGNSALGTALQRHLELYEAQHPMRENP